MNEARMINDARRAWYCRPGAEEVELVICDLGTPWCAVDHNEDNELEEMSYGGAPRPKCIPKRSPRSIEVSPAGVWRISYQSCEGDHLLFEIEETATPKIQTDHYERVIAKIKEQDVPSPSCLSPYLIRSLTLGFLFTFVLLMTWVAVTL